MCYTIPEALGLFLLKSYFPGRQWGLFSPGPKPGVVSLSFLGWECRIWKSSRRKPVPEGWAGTCLCCQLQNSFPGSTPSGPHLSKCHGSLCTCSWEGPENTPQNPFCLYSCHGKFRLPLPPGPTCVLPKLFYSLILFQRAPLLRVEWEEGSWSSLQKLHREPTITPCCMQARTWGRSSGWARRDAVLNVSSTASRRGPWFGGRRSWSPEPNLLHSWPEVMHAPQASQKLNTENVPDDTVILSFLDTQMQPSACSGFWKAICLCFQWIAFPIEALECSPTSFSWTGPLSWLLTFLLPHTRFAWLGRVTDADILICSWQEPQFALLWGSGGL